MPKVSLYPIKLNYISSLNIGVAPGSKWIACKGFKDDGSATQSKLLECGQFMFCPHDFQQKNPKCSLAPAVVRLVTLCLNFANGILNLEL